MNPKLLATCRALAAGEKPWPLYLYSPGPGTGKTCAGLVMLDHYGPVRRDRKYSDDIRDFMSGFLDFAALPDLFRAADKGQHFCSAPEACRTLYPSDLWVWVKGAELLVVDDVRRPGDREHRLGDDHYGIFKRILDERVGKGLIITSNIEPWEPKGGGTPELVRVFDDRIADRVTCGTMYRLMGDSRRGEGLA